MTSAKNRKLCWNCEGSVHMHATKCPYCGTDLTAEAPVQPTYEAQPRAMVQESPIPAPPYQPPQEELPQTFEPQLEKQAEPKVKVKKVRPAREEGSRPEIVPMLLLLPGAFFLLFGLILLLFSNDGTLTLKWNAHYWFFYLAMGAPLLYFGWRTLRGPQPAPQRVKNDPPSSPFLQDDDQDAR